MQTLKSVFILFFLFTLSALSYAAEPEDSLAATDSFVIYLDKEGQVWTWGEDLRGSMALGSLSSAPISSVKRINDDLKLVIKAHRLPLKNIKAVKATRTTAYALGEDGELWVWGFFNRSGIRGNRSYNESISQVTKYENLSSINRLYTNERFSVAISDENNVFMWGDTPTCNSMFKSSSNDTPVNYLKNNDVKSIILDDRNEVIGLVKSNSDIFTCSQTPFKIKPNTVKLGLYFDGWQYAQYADGDWYRVNALYYERLTGIGEIKEIVENNALLIMLQADGDLLIWNNTQKDHKFTSKITVPAMQSYLYKPPEPITYLLSSSKNGIFALGKSGKVYMHSAQSTPVNRHTGPRGWFNPPEFFKIFDPAELKSKP